MHIFGDGLEHIGQLIKTMQARYDHMVENNIISEMDRNITATLLKNLSSDKFLRLVYHHKDDLKSQEQSIADVLYNERYCGKSDEYVEISSIFVKAIDSDIEFGDKHIRQTVETIFGKTRQTLIADTDKEFENFDIEKPHIFIRTITRCVKELTTGKEHDEVYNELHVYQPNINPTIPVE